MKNKILIVLLLAFLMPELIAAQQSGQPVQSFDELQDLLKKAREQQLVRKQQSLEKSQTAAQESSETTAANSNDSTARSPENNTSDNSNDSGDSNTISVNEAMEETAFRQAVKGALPLTDDQIRRLRKRVQETELAKSTLPEAPPKPVASSQFVSLAPGDNLPVIRLQQGFVSSLVFLDSTGAPWPIADYDLGNPQAFNVQWDKKSNTLLVQATKLFTYGNLAVRLQTLPTPVMLTLIPGQKIVDYRADLRIQGLGPNAKDIAVGQTMPPATSAILLSVLDHVPPPGAKKMDSGRDDVKAWIYGGKMFVRSQLPILSPVWDHTVTSADGMHAYQIPITSLLLLSEHGKVIQIKLKGF